MEQAQQYRYWRAKHQSYWRRARWHDYASRCVYMITMVKQAAVSPFSEIVRREVNGRVEYCAYQTQTGTIIDATVRRFRYRYPWLAIYTYVIMPDHVHLVLFISEPGHELSAVVRELKYACGTALGNGGPVFLKGFHDRICIEPGQLATMKNYVADNPRRLYFKKHRPEYFRTRHKIEINGTRYDTLGNIELLANPFRDAVIVSSKRSAEENRQLKERWIDNACRGGVLVSPFVSPAERAIAMEGARCGAGIILIVDNGFGERYKPYGQYFDLCAQGQLLVIAPEVHDTARCGNFRAKALEMNALARTIVATPLRLLT